MVTMLVLLTGNYEVACSGMMFMLCFIRICHLVQKLWRVGFRQTHISTRYLSFLEGISKVPITHSLVQAF
jgi:hypothetical protein